MWLWELENTCCTVPDPDWLLKKWVVFLSLLASNKRLILFKGEYKLGFRLWFFFFFCPLYTYPKFGPSLPHIDHQKGFLMSPSIVLRTKLLWAVSVNKGYYSHQAITLRPPGWWALRELRMETNGQPTAKPIQQSPPSPPPHSTPKEI